MAEKRRSEAPEIQVEISADTAEIDAAWGEDEPSPPSAPLLKPPPPVRARKKKPPPVAPIPAPPPSGQTEVSIEEDDPIEFDADVARDSMPTLPDANPLQYDVVPESERVTIPPAPRVPSLPRRRRKSE